MNELNTIRVKAFAELTDEDKAFLKEHKSELTQEEVTKFSEVFDEDGGKDDDEDEEAEGEGEGDGKIEASEKGKKKPKKATEGMVQVSASELAILRQKADEGAQAFTEMRKMQFGTEVGTMIFNETTKKGKIAPKSKDKVVTFMMSLSEAQLAKFREIVKELPESLSFAEVGDAGNTKVSSATEIDALITEKRKADPKLSYSEALKKVFAENPKLAAQHDDEVETGSTEDSD